jgi:p-cumate 2,3-dioxygenase beta subunit
MASPDNNLFYIADDHFRLSERVKRLMKRTAHVEFPRSKTLRLVSNVRILAQTEDSLSVSSAFITYRTKDAVTDTYFGNHYYQFVRDEAGLKIREKRSMLASDGLRAQCRISIII